MLATQKVYAMLGNESLWDVAVQTHELLQRAQIPHSICGGVAVCLHGYQRNTTDLDLIVEPIDSERVRESLLSVGYSWAGNSWAGYSWDSIVKEFQSPNRVKVQFLLAGSRAGKGSDVMIPRPAGDLNVEEREGLLVVRLSRLIEMKIACGAGSLRRTHKDFADVVELIAIRNLDSSFARYLHKSLRETYRELVHRAQADC